MQKPHKLGQVIERQMERIAWIEIGIQPSIS